ncbi:hypothetical protein Hanom_Chr07g00610801 [Helianthus anomalus]
MGRGFGRGWAENAQATTPGGHGFGRGPFFVGLKPGVGRASKVTWQALNGYVSTQWLSCPQPKLPTQAPPYPIGVSFFFPFFSHFTCQQMSNSYPNPSPPYPTVLSYEG